jgi:hypothetical protein
MSHLTLIESDIVDVVKLLENLTARAKVGDVTGIAFMVTRRDGGYSTGFAGRAYTDPEVALAAIQLLQDDLKKRARTKVV